MTDIKCKYEVCTCAVPHDLCPHPLGWASEDEVRSLAERLCGTFDRFDGFPMEVAREALRWRDETRPVQAQPAAVAVGWGLFVDGRLSGHYEDEYEARRAASEVGCEVRQLLAAERKGES